MKLGTAFSCFLALAFVSGCSKCAGNCGGDSVPDPTITTSTVQSDYSKPLERTDTTIIDVYARVKAVDYAGRTITLEGPKGEVQSLKVTDAVKRLNEIKTGDMVKVTYQQSLVIEAREPTAEELATPAAAVALAGRADASSAPGAGLIQGIRTVVEVVQLDKVQGTVGVKTSAGDVYTVKARDPKNLDRIKVGSKIVVTYLEAFAVGVEKQ